MAAVEASCHGIRSRKTSRRTTVTQPTPPSSRGARASPRPSSAPCGSTSSTATGCARSPCTQLEPWRRSTPTAYPKPAPEQDVKAMSCSAPAAPARLPRARPRRRARSAMHWSHSAERVASLVGSPRPRRRASSAALTDDRDPGVERSCATPNRHLRQHQHQGPCPAASRESQPHLGLSSSSSRTSLARCSPAGRRSAATRQPLVAASRSTSPAATTRCRGHTRSSISTTPAESSSPTTIRRTGCTSAADAPRPSHPESSTACRVAQSCASAMSSVASRPPLPERIGRAERSPGPRIRRCSQIAIRSPRWPRRARS